MEKPFKSYFKEGVKAKKCCMKCDKPIFSKKLCKYHWGIEYSKRKKEELKPLLDADDKFLVGLWKEVDNHVCENCGCSLGNEFKKWFADHLIDKAKHNELRYEPANIWWLCLPCHRNKTDLRLSAIMIQKINDTKKYFGITD